MSADNPRLIYCSARGFLNGPYEHRTALDEVAQMMGGLAYMTGLPGRPMRAGASVIDVTGGMFAAIAILAALQMRHQTGRGQQVASSLYESTVFLMGQHMAQQAVSGQPAQPMSIRTAAWSIYDIFNSKDEQQVFVAVVSDTQWRLICEHFDLKELAEDAALATNAERVLQRERIIPIVQEQFSAFTKAELMAKLETCGLPFAGVGTPSDLFDDPHLLESGGLLDVTIPGGEATRLPALPIQMDGKRLGVRRDIPAQGQDVDEVLEEAGYSSDEIAKLISAGVVAAAPGD